MLVIYSLWDEDIKRHLPSRKVLHPSRLETKNVIHDIADACVQYSLPLHLRFYHHRLILASHSFLNCFLLPFILLILHPIPHTRRSFLHQPRRVLWCRTASTTNSCSCCFSSTFTFAVIFFHFHCHSFSSIIIFYINFLNWWIQCAFIKKNYYIITFIFITQFAIHQKKL